MHRTILFLDYIRFRQENVQLMEMADQGNYLPVFDKAKEIANKIESNQWILDDLGTTWRGFPTSVDMHMPSHTIGFSFLIILSQFLKPIPLPTPSLGQLAKLGVYLDWDERDVKLLTDGMATTTILKPEVVPDDLERPPVPDPRWDDPVYYWWWLRPQNAFYTGWWDQKKLKGLFDKLINIKVNEIEKINVSSFDDRLPITKHTLLENHSNTIKLFKLALEQDLGLLSIVS